MPSRFSVLVAGAKAIAAVLLMLSLIGVVVSVDAHPAAAQSTGAAIVSAAASQTGVPYCDGGGGINGPSLPTNGETCPAPGYSCMSLAQYAVYQVTGITVPSNGELLPGGQQWDGQGTGLGKDQGQLQPGDVVFFGGSDLWHYAHSGIYAGGGEVWDALQTGVPVGEHTMADLTSIYTNYQGGVRYSSTSPVTTSVALPSAGAALRGGTWLDANATSTSSISTVQFVLTGGTFNESVIGTGTSTIYGYLFGWNTASVPDGSYTLQSLATDAASNTAYSAGISVIVDNTPPTTSVLVPSTGATVKGGTWLDAGAADNISVKSVQFVLTGGAFNKSVIGTATATIYGYLFGWTTTSVPDASYTLQSLATDEAGNTTYGKGITVKVKN